MKTLVLACCVTAILCMSLRCTKSKPDISARRSAYWWQTTFDPNDSAIARFIRQEHVGRVYLRYFDVVERDGQPMPNATVRCLGDKPHGMEIVPVVFVLNDCLKPLRPGSPEVADLAGKTFERVMQMTATNALGPLKEIQIDCDWTLSTRRTFFDFLKTLGERTHERGLKLSATVRLHQLSQPAPPADRGVLMVYNTGDVRDYHNQHPIIDIADVRPYLGQLAGYRLPLSAAYPIFSWRVLFRAHRFVGIVHSDDEYPILPGDEVVTRDADLTHIMQAHDTIARLRPDAHDEIILYDLQKDNIKRFKRTDYEKIYHR